MTDRVNPSPNRTVDPYQTSFAIKHASAGADWIAHTSTSYVAPYAGLTGSPLNAFNANYTGTSLDIEIRSGEGFIGGAWLGRDVLTPITLSPSTTTNIYLGWSSMAPDTVLVGTSDIFNARDQRVEIWRFTTDASGVTTAVDLRTIGPSINRQNLFYDANGDGKIDAANHADTADSATTATSATTAATADNATNFDGRDSLDVLRETVTLSLPVAQIEPGERYQVPYLAPSGSTMKVLRTQRQTNSHTSPSSLIFRIRNSSGSVVYSNTSKSNGGTLSNPVYSGGSDDYLFGLENTASSTTYQAGGYAKVIQD